MKNNQELSNIELLLELEQRLKTGTIYFQIDKQNCYLIENNFHYTNKIKVGDLSLTKEHYLNKWKKIAKEYWEKNQKEKLY